MLSCYVHNNKSNSDRGCIYVYYNYNSHSSTISHCRIENNKAQYGGGIYSRAGNYRVNIINNLIVGNEATTRGGGVYAGSGSSAPANVWLLNNTIMNNQVSHTSASEGGDGDGSGVFAEGGIYAYNNVIANNTGPDGCRQVANMGGNLWFEYNAIQDLDDITWNAESGSGINQNNINLDGDEDLFDSTTNYVPAFNSLLVNEGSKVRHPDYVPNSAALVDLKGDRRVQGGQIDIGAYEYETPPFEVQIVLHGTGVRPYNGEQYIVTATTVPEGLPVTITYNESPEHPYAVGDYRVCAVVDCWRDDVHYKGSAVDTLEIKQFVTITASTDGNGTIEPAGEVEVTTGESITFTISPKENYVIDSVIVDGEPVEYDGDEYGGKYTFEEVTTNHSIHVTFKRMYSLTIKAGNGGFIRTDVSGYYPEGEVIEIAATAFFGHNFDKWTSSGAGTFGDPKSASTVFIMPAEDITITANFRSYIVGGVPYVPGNIYTITATAGTGGKITPSGTVHVVELGSAIFEIAPNQGYKISDVLVDGTSVGAVESYAFSYVIANHTIEARFEPIIPVTEPENEHYCPSERFNDLDPSSWYHEGVDFVLLRGLFYLPSNNMFEPDSNMTRAMLITALWRLEDEPEPVVENRFEDVIPGTWYEKAVIWGDEIGLVIGYDENTFGPDDPITREQIAVILHRYAAYKHYDLSATADLSVYNDLDEVSDWAISAMKWAVGNGIIKGASATELDPVGYATRAQVATLLMRLVNFFES